MTSITRPSRQSPPTFSMPACAGAPRTNPPATRPIRSTAGHNAFADSRPRAGAIASYISSMAQRFAPRPPRKLSFKNSRIEPPASFGHQQQVVGVARSEWRIDGGISEPIGRRHTVIEQNAEHPVAEPGESILDQGALAVGFVAGFNDQDWPVPAQSGGGSVENATLVPLYVDFDQVEPCQVAFLDERIEVRSGTCRASYPAQAGPIRAVPVSVCAEVTSGTANSAAPSWSPIAQRTSSA